MLASPVFEYLEKWKVHIINHFSGQFSNFVSYLGFPITLQSNMADEEGIRYQKFGNKVQMKHVQFLRFCC